MDNVALHDVSPIAVEYEDLAVMHGPPLADEAVLWPKSPSGICDLAVTDPCSSEIMGGNVRGRLRVNQHNRDNTYRIHAGSEDILAFLIPCTQTLLHRHA